MAAVKAGGGRASARSGAMRPFVAMQVAFSLIVLFVGGLLVRSFVKLSSVNPGFAVSDVLLVSWEAVQRIEPTQQRAALLQVLDRLARSAGVAAVSAAEFNASRPALAERHPVPGTHTKQSKSTMAPVTPGYFETMQIPLLAGRTFVRGDLDAGRSHRGHRQRILREALLRWRARGRPPVRCALRQRAHAERGRRRRGGCSLRLAQIASADNLHAAPAGQLPHRVRPRSRRRDSDRIQAAGVGPRRHAALARDVHYHSAIPRRSYARA